MVRAVTGDPQPRDPRDDGALLRAHAAGDGDAFAELVRRHRDRRWAVALRTLGDREEAADALQDALISAYRSAHRFRGDSAVTTWLHRIVVNACLDRARRRGARPARGADLARPPDCPAGRRATAERAQVVELVRTAPAGGRAHEVLAAAQPRLDAALAGLADEPIPAHVAARLDAALADAGGVAAGT